MEKNKGFFLVLIYFYLAIYLLPMFPHGGSASELMHWAAAASIVEKSSFEISWAEDLIGNNTETARFEGRVYSPEAPGIALLAAPVYALTRIFVGPPDASNIRISWFAIRFVFSTLPLLLLAFWLYAQDIDDLSLAVLLFATPLFLYSLLLVPYVLVAVLVYFAFRLLYDSRRNFLQNFFAGGFLCGLAFLCDFSSIFAALVFGAGLLFTDRLNRLRRLALFVTGFLPFAVFLLIYNYLLFDSPFSTAAAHASLPPWSDLDSPGADRIGFPSLSGLYLLLFSPSRGLFFYSPILIYSIVCYFTSPEQNTLRHRVKYWTIAVSVLFVSGHGALYSEWGAGARYLIFVLPLMLDSFFDGEVDEFSNVWQGLLLTISILFCAIPVLTFPFAPPEFSFPHNDFWWKLLFDERWFTPTLANVFGAPSGVGSILPAAAALILALLLVGHSARRPVRFAAGILIGAALVSAYLFLLDADSVEKEFRRATVAERFFKPAGRTEALKSSADPELSERIVKFERIVADTRASAPNDFPYLDTRELGTSPSRELKRALRLQEAGRPGEAEAVLRKAKEDFPFARCELSSGLAVALYRSGRREEAVGELESVQHLVRKDSRPGCLRSQYLLGLLYRELNRPDEARKMLQRFLETSQNSGDEEIRELRQGLAAP